MNKPDKKKVYDGSVDANCFKSCHLPRVIENTKSSKRL